MDNKQRIDDRESVASATTGSGYTGALSDLSALENETDDFGRKILQHQRAIRVRTSTTSSSRHQQPFSRARPRKSEPVSLETETDIRPLHRRTASDGSALASSTTTTADTNPPLNIPREWGRRARRRPDWLRSYESEGGGALGAAAAADTKMDEDSILPRRTAYTGDESPIMQWSPSGDVVMPSIELTPTGKRSRTATSPWSLRHMNTTLPLDSSVIEGQQDLTDASLLASTPAVNLRNRKVDSLMRYDGEKRTEKEKEKEKRTSSLSHISERSYESSTTRPVTAPSATDRVSRRRRSGASASDKENEPAQAIDFDTKDAPAVGFKSTRTYSHAREDSMALLRKLARVTSMSPSPAREAERLESQREARFSSRDEAKLKQEEPTRSRSDRIAAEVKKEERHIKRESDRPKSALEEVLRENRRDKNLDKALPLGESTLASLENIVAPELDDPSASASAHPEDKSRSKQTRTIKSEPASNTTDIIGNMTPSEKARRQEDLALAKLNNTLRSTRTTIKDANNGLRRIENKIEAASWSSSSSLPPPSSTTTTKSQPQPSNADDNDNLCKTCTSSHIRGYTSAWSSLFREFLSLFIRPSSSSSSPSSSLLGYRLTLLGVLSLLVAIWYTTETTLCRYYCHQPYATSMDGYGVDPDAPDFPFVIPTLMFRPWRATWQPVVNSLAVLVGGVYSLAFGQGGDGIGSQGTIMGKGRGKAGRSLNARGYAAAGGGFADIGGSEGGGALRGSTVRAVSEAAVKATTSSTARGWFAAAAKATQAAVAPSSIVHAVRQAGSRWEESFLPGE